jgi:hypothetical protein
MGMRRMTRLTNAFSKKWSKLHAMLALYFAHYNFCRVNGFASCDARDGSGNHGSHLDAARTY